MKLGLNLGYWGAGNDADNLVLAQEADRLGYAVVWAAEAYGSDAATVLAWVAAQTERIDVGSAIFQIPARTPAMTAMTAATLDTLSGRAFPARARGLRATGLGGLARGALRQAAGPDPRVRRHRAHGAGPQDGALRGRALDAAAAGRPGQGAAPHRPPGARAAARSTSRRSGPRTSSSPARSPTAGSRSSSPRSTPRSRCGTSGPGRADGRPAPWTGSTSCRPCRSSSATTSRRAPVRSAAYAALYVGGHGQPEAELLQRARRAHGLRGCGRRDPGPLPGQGLRAALRQPYRSELIDETSLIGPVDRVSDRLTAYAEAGVTTLSVSTFSRLARRADRHAALARRPRSEKAGLAS